MSMALLLIGMILMSVYTLIYLDQILVFKILLVINLLAGLLFMSSFMITTYQQYDSYLGALKIQGINPENPDTIPLPAKKNRKKQFLFFGGIILLAAGITGYFMLVPSWKNIAAPIVALLGVLMIASVFFKPKKKITSTASALSPASTKTSIKKITVAEAADKMKPHNSEKDALKKELLGNIRSGLDTLKKIEKSEDNKAIRKMLSEAIKSDMERLKTL
jgi:hypothetical protein